MNTTSTVTSARLPKIFKLRTAAEFQSVYKKGAKSVSRSFVIFMLPNNFGYSRFGLTTPRKLGDAPDRNRIKRRVREILRTAWASVPRGIDIVINPRSSACKRVFSELRSELLGLLGVAV